MKPEQRFPTTDLETPTPPLMKAARTATLLGFLSPALWAAAALVNTESLFWAALYSVRFGVLLSVGCVFAAFAKAEGYRRHSLRAFPLLISMPLLVSLPVHWIGAIAVGLGGYSAESDLCVWLLAASAGLLLVVPVAASVAVRKARA